jgi:uncharacterized membrane protein YcaP (DUF421 family)
LQPATARALPLRLVVHAAEEERMDWTAVLRPEIPWIEKLVRPCVVYIFLLVAFRLAGKRELGQMTAFDLVVLLTVSNVLQNAMIGADNSLGGGILGAVALLSANGLVARLLLRAPRLERWVLGQPTPLIEDGRILRKNMRHEVMTMSELERAIRKHDLDPATDLVLIRRALLEQDGSVTIMRRGKH